MPINYQNGKIYKIVSNTDDDICYVGSTTRPLLCQRMADHNKGYKSWKRGKGDKTTSFELFDKYGFEKCSIELIEIFPCNSKDELAKKEGGWIRKLNCVNKRVEGRTKVEWLMDNPEYQKKWREANKDTIVEYFKEWREANRDTIREKAKEYHNVNRIKILEYAKNYRDANMDTILKKQKEKYTCCCGSTLRKSDKARHEKSQKHMNYISSNTI